MAETIEEFMAGWERRSKVRSEQFVTEQMCAALERLDRVPTSVTFYPQATAAVFSDVSSLRPRKSQAAAEMMEGRALALALWYRRAWALTDLKYPDEVDS